MPAFVDFARFWKWQIRDCASAAQNTDHKMTYCCKDLENFGQRTGAGLVLLTLIDKGGPRFFIEYRKDWDSPIAEAGIQIRFCPYCGRKLLELFPGYREDRK